MPLISNAGMARCINFVPLVVFLIEGKKGKKQVVEKRKMSKSQQLRISTVIGNTVAYNATICDNQQGDIAYAAGAVGVIYSIKEERQRQFLHGHSTKPITCLRFSPSGRYLAAGESGKDPKVYVWEVETGALAAQLASFHRLGVLGLAFSQADGGKHLMTVGFQNDGQLAVWDWRQK